MTAEVRAKIGAAVEAERHPNWTGGHWAAAQNQGRMYVRVPKAERHLHPTIRRDGYIRRYHYVWNRAHPEDPVRRGEVIHHQNEDPTDDRLENLFKTVQSKHAREHGAGRKHRPESRTLMREVQKTRRERERGRRHENWTVEMCGTSRGYFRHYAAGEPACQPCLTAHAERTREARALSRAH